MGLLLLPTNMKLFKILVLVSSAAAAPQSYFPRWGFAAAPQIYYSRIRYLDAPQSYSPSKGVDVAPQSYSPSKGVDVARQSYSPRIDVDKYVDEVQKESYLTDNSVKVDVSSKSPSSVSALAYVTSVEKDGLCCEAAEVYVKSILNGESQEAAAGEATRAYITAFNSGERYKKGGACEAAENAWKVASASGDKDHVLEATLAFMKKCQELRMVILVLLLGLIMLERYLLATHIMMLLPLQ